MLLGLQKFVENSKRLIEQICCTAQSDLNLLERLLPAPFLLEGLKAAMMFLHDRLFCVQHQTIDSCHRCLRSRNRWLTIPDHDPYGNHRNSQLPDGLTSSRNMLYLFKLIYCVRWNDQSIRPCEI